MLREHWYIAATSHKLRRKPIQRQLLGEQLVLWRDAQGQPHALNNTCIHRGVPLSLGTVDENCIRCPYHGWAFNGAGECVEVPANGPGGKVPPNARTRAYPTVEKGGYIWVYTGLKSADERPPLYVPEELTSPLWCAGRRADDIQTHYTRVIEHNIDIAHLPWVHKNTIGRPMTPHEYIERPLRIRENGLSIALTNSTQPTLTWLPKRFYDLVTAGAADVNMPDDGLHLDMPNLFRISLAQTGIIMGMYAVPLDEQTTRIHQYVARCWLTRQPILTPLFNRLLLAMNMYVLREDLAMLEGQVPKRMPDKISDEFHVRTDEAQIHYRRLRAAYYEAHPHERPVEETHTPGSWAVNRAQLQALDRQPAGNGHRTTT